MLTKLFRLFSQSAKAISLTLLTVVLLNGTVMLNEIAMPTRSANIAMSRAADQLDQIAGEGTSAQIEGKVQRDIGTVKRDIGEVTGQVEGAADQVKGKVKGDIGRTQDATEEVRDAVEDASEGFVDAGKDLFD